MLRSRRCSPSRSRICACTVTSSAVVGSSARIIVGPQARAMAIITRWRMPPDISCGYCLSRRAASGMRTSLSSFSAVSIATGRVHAEVDLQRLGDLLADLHQRVQRGHRVLEDHRHLPAPDAAHLLAALVADLLALEDDRALAHGVGRGQQAHDRARQDRLARAALADDAERLAAAQLEADPVDGAHHAARRAEVGAHVGQLEQHVADGAADAAWVGLMVTVRSSVIRPPPHGCRTVGPARRRSG